MSKDHKYPRVILFTAPSCSYSRMAKNYLRQPHKPKTKSTNLYCTRGQQGVPVLDIGGKIGIGFNWHTIDRYLGLG